MAKKKQKKNWRQELLRPISLKRSLVLLVMGGGLFILNSFSFINTPAVNQPKELSLLDQSEIPAVLGTTVTENEDQTYRSFLNQPTVEYWYQISKQKPDYRDAYVQLAVLAYNDHLCSLARTHLIKAMTLDQTDTTIQNLVPIIEACGN